MGAALKGISVYGGVRWKNVGYCEQMTVAVMQSPD